MRLREIDSAVTWKQGIHPLRVLVQVLFETPAKSPRFLGGERPYGREIAALPVAQFLLRSKFRSSIRRHRSQAGQPLWRVSARFALEPLL